MASNKIYLLAANLKHAFMLYEEHATDIMIPEYVKYLKLYGSTEQYFYPLINVDSGNGEQVYYILAITDTGDEKYDVGPHNVYSKMNASVDSISVNGMDVKMIIIPKKCIGLQVSKLGSGEVANYNIGFYKTAVKIISICNGLDGIIKSMYRSSHASSVPYHLIYEDEGIIPTIIKIMEALYYATIACSGVKYSISVEDIIEDKFADFLSKPILSAMNNLLACDPSVAFMNTVTACDSIGADNMHELLDHKFNLACYIRRFLE